MMGALRRHWPEYVMEAAELGAFMLSACLFGTLLEHPASPVRQALPDGTLRRVLMGMAMGLTGAAIVYSPWGKQSGAHFNPSVTLTFWRLGKVRGADAAGYVFAQFAGGMLGVAAAALALGGLLADPAVNYVVTRPGAAGILPAFGAEVAISFLLMTVVLRVSSHPRLASWTGVFAGCMVALYIVLEAPISGMSMNPARTFGSAFSAQVWTALWIYFIAPPLGMILASEAYLRLKGAQQVLCAKLHHDNDKRCIFRCNYGG